MVAISSLFKQLAMLTVIGWVLVIAILLGMLLFPHVKLLQRLGRWGIVLAMIVAIMATYGSLSFGQYMMSPAGMMSMMGMMQTMAGKLCMFQRTAMYPIAPLLALGLLTDARVFAVWSGVFLSVIGGTIAAFDHVVWMVETPIPPFSPFAPLFGFITVPLMALTAFTLIALFLILWWRGDVIQPITASTVHVRHPRPISG